MPTRKEKLKALKLAISKSKNSKKAMVFKPKGLRSNPSMHKVSKGRKPKRKKVKTKTSESEVIERDISDFEGFSPETSAAEILTQNDPTSDVPQPESSRQREPEPNAPEIEALGIEAPAIEAPQNRVESVIQFWPPYPPDVAHEHVMALVEPQAIKTTSHTAIYRFKHDRKAYKTPSTQREFDLMVAAGDCAVRVHGRSFVRNRNGQVYMAGIVMDLEQEFIPRAIGVQSRYFFMQEMIALIRKLHERGIIHGDIKPHNFVLCSGWKLRLCDFADGMKVQEDRREAKWGRRRTANYLAPSRLRNWPAINEPPPEKRDDLYALGLSIWTLYTGREPYHDIEDDVDIMWAVKNGRMVDLNKVRDVVVRDVIRGYLRYGGATV